MRIEIDQSWKIEKTEKDTILAFSNKIERAVRFSAEDKRYLQKFFRNYGEPRLFVYKTFAALVFLLIEPFLPQVSQIIIDKEYPGYEALITGYLWGLLQGRTKRLSLEDIDFALIGEKSRAHSVAYLTFVGERKEDVVVKLDEILRAVVRIKP